MASNGAQYFLSKVRAVEQAKSTGLITDERISTMMEQAQKPLKMDPFGDRSTKKELATYVKILKNDLEPMMKLETVPSSFSTPKNDRKRQLPTADREETTPSPKRGLSNDKKIMIRLSPNKTTSPATESATIETPASQNETRPTITSYKNGEGKIVLKLNRSPMKMAPTPPTTMSITPPTTPQKPKLVIKLSPKKTFPAPVSTQSSCDAMDIDNEETNMLAASSSKTHAKTINITTPPTPSSRPVRHRKPTAKAQEAEKEKEKAKQTTNFIPWVPLGPITLSSTMFNNNETATKNKTEVMPEPAKTCITDNLYLDTITTLKKLGGRHSNSRFVRGYHVNDEDNEMTADIIDAMATYVEDGETEMDEEMKEYTKAAKEQNRAFDATKESMEKESSQTRTSFDIDIAYPKPTGNYKLRIYHERYSDDKYSGKVRSDETTEMLFKERAQEKVASNRDRIVVMSKLCSDMDRYTGRRRPVQLRQIEDAKWWEHRSLRINKVQAFKKAVKAEIEADELYRAFVSPRKSSRDGNISPEQLVLIRRGISQKFVFEEKDRMEMPRRDSHRGKLRDESKKYLKGRQCAEQAAQYYNTKRKITDIIRRHQNDNAVGGPALSALPLHIRRLTTMRGAPCSHHGDGYGTVLPSRGYFPPMGCWIEKNGEEIGYLPAGLRGEQRRSGSQMKGRRMWRSRQ